MNQDDATRVEKVTKTLMGQVFHSGDLVTLRFETQQFDFLNGRHGVVVSEREYVQQRAGAIGSEQTYSYTIAVEGEVKLPQDLMNCAVLKTNVLKIDERFIFPRVG